MEKRQKKYNAEVPFSSCCSQQVSNRHSVHLSRKHFDWQRWTYCRKITVLCRSVSNIEGSKSARFKHWVKQLFENISIQTIGTSFKNAFQMFLQGCYCRFWHWIVVIMLTIPMISTYVEFKASCWQQYLAWSLLSKHGKKAH